MPNAIDLLKKDHDEVREKLAQLADTTERAKKTREKLLEELGIKLRVHAKIEEEIFYPAVREAAEQKEHLKMVAEAFEEHRVVEKMVLPDLEKTDPESIEFSGRAKVLKELVEHHADEEEDDMFPFVRKLLSKAALEELGETMQERKQELLAAATE